MTTNRTYNLVWINSNKVKETIITGSIKLCQWKKNQLTNYPNAELKIVSNEALKATQCK